MSENPSLPAPEGDDLAPVDPAQAAPATPPTPPDDTGTPPAPRLRDRVFRLRSVVAVAAAGVIVGGVAGAGLTAVADGHGDRRPELGRNGFGPGQAPGMSGGMPGMPGGQGFPGMPGGGMPGQQGQQQGQQQGLPQGQVPQAQPSADKSS